jgi:hypothetical protein
MAVQITHIRSNQNRTQFERTRILFDFVRAAFASPRTACTDLSRRLSGSTAQFSDKSSALHEVAALRRKINLNRPHLSPQAITVSELVNHYRQRELATDQYLEDTLDQGDLPGLPE